MKTSLRIVLLVMLTAGLSSCQKIKSLFDVEFDTTLSEELYIDIPESVTKSTDFVDFKASALMNPLSDDDIDEYSENIKEFDVKTILGEVTYASDEDIVFKSGTAFYIKDNSTEITWTIDSDWPVTVGTKMTLGDIGNNIYVEVGKILKKLEPFTVGIAGECSKDGISVDVDFIIEVTVAASPL